MGYQSQFNDYRLTTLEHNGSSFLRLVDSCLNCEKIHLDHVAQRYGQRDCEHYVLLCPSIIIYLITVRLLPPLWNKTLHIRKMSILHEYLQLF
jgi:hypothetical protein